MDDQFAQDVLKGLTATPKHLSSKYFYDEKGDALFQQIMELEEYYLTRTEYSILDNNKQELLDAINGSSTPFELIEFGAGDGLKTKILLRHFLNEGADFKYLPIDISQNALDKLSDDLAGELPGLTVNGLQGEYFEALKSLSEVDKTKKLVLFLGSNIGNFTNEQAASFLNQLATSLNTGDMLLIGIDLKKDPDTILDAYNDKQGVTRDFNLNLLHRINNELGGEFELDNFMHYPIYEPQTGEAKSFLLSKKEQNVNIHALNLSVHFEAWEAVHMEISKKYSSSEVQGLMRSAGFEVKTSFYDEKSYFVNVLCELS